MSMRLEEQNGRRSFLKWAGVLSALGLLRSPQAALAEKDERHRGRADIVGTWIVQITFTSPPESKDVSKRGLSQFTAAGQWIGTESALEPDSKVDGSWRQTLYVGQWTSTQDGEIEVRGRRMYKSEEGILLVITFTRMQLSLEPDGEAWQGEFRTQTVGPSGVEQEFTGFLDARRVG